MTEPKSIEITAADVDAAIARGVSELGVSRDEVMIEVIEEPGRRLLGLGTKQAKVRLTVIRAPGTPPASAGQQASTAAAPAPTPQPAPVPATQVVAPVHTSQPAPAARVEEPKPAPSRVESPANDADVESDADDSPAASFDDLDEDEWASKSVSVSEEDLVEDAKIGAETLQKLLDYMQVSAKVGVKQAETDGNESQHWTLEIQGRDLGALIGRKGETLAALQYITRLITSRDLERRANIVIDVEGYKSRREMMLRRLAKRMAEQAVQRGRTVSLEPMPPHERRIIHLALRDNQNVTTESVGDGDKRKVTIVPKRAK